MGMHNKLAASLTAITNASRLHKPQIIVRYSSTILISFLQQLQKFGYISYFTRIYDKRSEKVFIKLNGRLRKASAIVPRYNLKYNKGDIERFRESVLPARQFGKMIISSSIGMIDHQEAVSK